MNDNNVWDTRSSLLVLPSVAWRLANDWLLLSFQCERHTHTIQCLWSIPGSTVWVDRVVKWVYDNVVYSHNSIGTATVLTDITRFLFEEKLIVAGHIRFAHVLWKYNSLYTNCMVEGRTQVRLHCISPVEGVQSNITEVISPRDLVGSIIRQKKCPWCLLTSSRVILDKTWFEPYQLFSQMSFQQSIYDTLARLKKDLPTELKHIIKWRKRNQQGFP